MPLPENNILFYWTAPKAVFFSSSCADEEQRQHAGADMNAGERLVHGDYKLLRFGNGTNHFGELFGILKAIAVAYGNALMLRIDGFGLVLMRNGLYCFLPAAEL